MIVAIVAIILIIVVGSLPFLASLDAMYTLSKWGEFYETGRRL